MNLYLSRPVGLACCLLLLGGGLTACGGSVAEESVAGGSGLSDLAPTYDVVPRSPGPQARSTRAARATSEARRGGAAGGSDTRRTSDRRRRSTEPTSDAVQRADGRERPSVPRQAPADPGPSTVTDPAGDLSTSLEGKAASADIVAVHVDVTGDTVEVRTTFAGEVPERMTGGKGMNVASFFDVDGNGLVDYEIWVSLVEEGWGTGYRDAREGTAAFGSSTGIEVAVAGRSLTTRFPLDRIDGATSFRWSAASEWGSHESMAASTSARDHAPDSGAAGYPG